MTTENDTDAAGPGASRNSSQLVAQRAWRGLILRRRSAQFRARTHSGPEYRLERGGARRPDQEGHNGPDRRHDEYIVVCMGPETDNEVAGVGRLVDRHGLLVVGRGGVARFRVGGLGGVPGLDWWPGAFPRDLLDVHRVRIGAVD